MTAPSCWPTSSPRCRDKAGFRMPSSSWTMPARRPRANCWRACGTSPCCEVRIIWVERAASHSACRLPARRVMTGSGCSTTMPFRVGMRCTSLSARPPDPPPAPAPCAARCGNSTRWRWPTGAISTAAAVSNAAWRGAATPGRRRRSIPLPSSASWSPPRPWPRSAYRKRRCSSATTTPIIPCAWGKPAGPCGWSRPA